MACFNCPLSYKAWILWMLADGSDDQPTFNLIWCHTSHPIEKTSNKKLDI